MILSAAVMDRLTTMRKLMLGYYTRDSCIAATRMGIDILHAQGRFDAAPVQAMCVILNPKSARALHRGLPPEAACSVEGGHSIGIGWPAPGRRPLHVIIRGDGFLADLSLDQACRPAKKIQLEPTMFPVSGEQAAALDAGAMVWWMVNGCAVGYVLRPDLISYLDSPNWNERDADVRAEILARVKATHAGS